MTTLTQVYGSLLKALCLLAVCALAGCGSPSTPSAPPAAPAPPVTTSPPPPAPERLFHGRVADIEGRPLADVRVNGFGDNGQTGPMELSDATGAFALTTSATSGVAFSKDGYRYGSARSDGSAADVAVDAYLQPILVASATAPLAARLTPLAPPYRAEYEESFWGGDYYCSPCLEIRTPGGETARQITVAWTGDVPLVAYVGDYYNGPLLSAEAKLGMQQLQFEVRGASFNTMLIGIRRGASLPGGQPLALTITVSPDNFLRKSD